jgi:ureidoacrylate peracid hydrolase
MTLASSDVIADPKTTVLTIIDMVNDFCKKKGEHYVGSKADRLIARTSSLLNTCRKAGVKVVFVKPSRVPTLPEFTVFERKPHLLEGSWNVQIIDELSPREGEYVLKKSTHDCFYKTEMDAVLTKLGLNSAGDNAVVTGVATNICVYHAILGFHVRDYRVIIPNDCVAASPPSMQGFVEKQLSLPGYRYNVVFTESKRISFSLRP